MDFNFVGMHPSPHHIDKKLVGWAKGEGGCKKIYK